MWLDLVGIRIDLRDADAATRALLQSQWAEFVGDESVGGDAGIRLETRVDPSILNQGPAPEAVITRKDGVHELLRYDFQARWDARTRIAEVCTIGTAASFSSFLRVLLSIVLREHGGVLFHASSVRLAGSDEAFLFPGISGTGKLTIAELAAPRGILSDEISCVRPWKDADRSGMRVFPTPFWGDLVRKRAAPSAPLKNIVLLKRGGSALVTKATTAQGFAGLLEGALFFESESARDEKRAVLAAAQAIAASVPALTLRFDLPENPWPVLDPIPA